MKKNIALSYGAIGLFLGAYTYLGASPETLSLPKPAFSGETSSLLASASLNTGLLFLFGLQHSIMSKPSFKVVGGRLLSQARERSRSLLMSNMVMALIAAMLTGYIIVSLPREPMTEYGSVTNEALMEQDQETRPAIAPEYSAGDLNELPAGIRI